MRIADWIIRVATRNPPQAREQWARAMAAEYASLTENKLRWALGCWMAMLWWRLYADRAYFFASFAMAAFIISPLSFLMWAALPRSLIHLGFYPQLTAFLPACLILGILRPDRAYLSAFMVFLIPNAVEYISMYLDGWFIAPHAETRITIHDAPQLVGLTSDMGGCLAGALLGRALRLHVFSARNTSQ